MKVFLDTETCGLHGMAVLIQYAFDDGEIILYDVWKNTISDTLALIESFCECEVIGFNLAFDWFHLAKLYTVFSLYPDPSAYPEDIIEELAILEPKGRFGPCIKPKAACDLMLHSRKGPYQSLMARDDIRIKKVPAILADALAEELEKRVEIEGIYFARRKDKWAPKWKVFDIEGRPEVKDVVLKFAPKGDLKTLAMHALGVKEDALLRFSDIEIDKVFFPEEQGWAPYALALGKPGNWKDTWPAKIKYHIDHWCYRLDARKYATDDVVYTRGLYKHFGCPPSGDDDSELACMVAVVRWRGFNVDIEAMREQKIAAMKQVGDTPVAPGPALYYITEPLDPDGRKAFGTSTKKVLLEDAKSMPCDCYYDPDIKDCQMCGGDKIHPAGKRAMQVLNARKAIKEGELYDKIIGANRFHASFRVIGTLSSRMSGADGLNPQGINASKSVRRCFTLADDGFILCGGDFDAFEVVLADAAYDDEKLRFDLTNEVTCGLCTGTGVCRKCKGQGTCKDCASTGKCDECGGKGKAVKKIHALFACEIFPDKTFEEIMQSKGSKVKDYYKEGKTAVFAMIYGGDAGTLVRKQKIDPEVAQRAYEGFIKKYPKMGEARSKIISMFCSMVQEGGLGSKIVWNEPAEYIESLMGFRRYFKLENAICRALFGLAETPPKSWSDIKVKITRNPERGPQFVGGAVRSAVFAAAFGIQAAAMRAAANHVIQSSGATITKKVQRNVWGFQPVGVHPWVVVPMNIHDEVLAPCKPEVAEAVQKTVYETIETFRPRVPLIKMEWKIGMKNWAEK